MRSVNANLGARGVRLPKIDFMATALMVGRLVNGGRTESKSLSASLLPEPMVVEMNNELVVSEAGGGKDAMVMGE